jgi:hypothetical protein
VNSDWLRARPSGDRICNAWRFTWTSPILHGVNSDWLRARPSGDRIPVVRDFPPPSRSVLGPTEPPIKWVLGLISGGVKRPGRGVNHPPLSSTEVKERVKLYFYSSSGPLWPLVGWTLPFALPPYCGALVGKTSASLILRSTV